MDTNGREIKQLFVWIRVHSWLRTHTGLEGLWPSRFGPAQARVRGHRTEPRMDTNEREIKQLIRVNSRLSMVKNNPCPHHLCSSRFEDNTVQDAGNAQELENTANFVV